MSRHAAGAARPAFRPSRRPRPSFNMGLFLTVVILLGGLLTTGVPTFEVGMGHHQEVTR